MSLVLDSSASLAWHFEDERTPLLMALLDRVTEEGATVPSLWRFETANGLQMAVRRKRIDTAYRERALRNLSALNIRIDVASESLAWSTTVGLASLYDLTVYDAAYLELAQRRRLPLASLDAALVRAAGRAGVAILPLT
jgi:predicted nucleic acid-binding protein